MYGSIPVLRLPRWVTTYAATTYFFALAIVSLIYLSHCLPWYFMVSGGLSTLQKFDHDICSLHLRELSSLCGKGAAIEFRCRPNEVILF